MPGNIGIVDLFIGFPMRDKRLLRAGMAQLLKDTPAEGDEYPIAYMFKDVPAECPPDVDPVEVTLSAMDRNGIERGLVDVRSADAQQAIHDHPGRFIPSLFVDPNEGMSAVRAITDAREQWGIRLVDMFPAGCQPQVPINDRRMYPIYAKCVELDIAVGVTAGVPGPRVPFACQRVELIDEVMYDFPELTFITRHGCEPWADLAVKLMLKWPNLYYSTSAFAPKHYPKAIIDYANTRGADKVIYAGYFPLGLSLERIMSDMREVPFKDEVWPKFLRGNAERALRLDSGANN